MFINIILKQNMIIDKMISSFYDNILKPIYDKILLFLGFLLVYNFILIFLGLILFFVIIGIILYPIDFIIGLFIKIYNIVSLFIDKIFKISK